MKPARFDYVRPNSLAEALEVLGAAEDGSIRPIAGGQSLGPMLNFRVAQPETVVDIARLPELTGWREEPDGAVVIGAAVTHAAIEDGRVPDPTGGILRRVAFGIAYRAVRNRGTIGGSLAHADPAADWPTVLAALGAECVIAGKDGTRAEPAAGFVRGIFETALRPGELLAGIRVRPLPRGARWGYFKFCRKTGEFADSMAAVVVDGSRTRAALGALQGPPLLLSDETVSPQGVDERALAASLAELGIDGGYEQRVHRAALRRALQQAMS